MRWEPDQLIICSYSSRTPTVRPGVPRTCYGFADIKALYEAVERQRAGDQARQP
jgi:hypothetical protein